MRIFAFLFVTFLPAAAVGGVVTFAPDVVVIDPAVSATAQVQVYAGDATTADGTFDTLDLIIGSDVQGLIANFTYSSETVWLYRETPQPSRALGTPFYAPLGSTYVGGLFKPPSASLWVGTLVLDATGVAPGEYTVRVDSEYDDLSAMGLFGEADLGTFGSARVIVGGDVPVNFVSSVPVHTPIGTQVAPAQGTLCRSARNTLRLTFDGALAAVPLEGELEINELTNGGFGSNIATAANGFAFTLESGDTVLRIRDDDATSNFRHQKWYAIRNLGAWRGANPFEIHFPVNVGDANGDGRTVFTDLGFINTQVPTSPAPDQARRDINGDGSILFSDMGAANAKVPADLVPKPSGH